jgi:hypothetical protein
LSFPATLPALRKVTSLEGLDDGEDGRVIENGRPWSGLASP